MTAQHRTYAEETTELARRTLRDNRVAVFVVSYNAERHIEAVLERIPEWVARSLAEVFIIDDSSTDASCERARGVTWPADFAPLRIYSTPYNQGYGGNQRLGYLYAIQKGFDIVVLLHGDGQYSPESLPDILAEYSRPAGADAVYGSRFAVRGGALRGRMPLYKYVGNRVLTWLQNHILGTCLSEMHSGYRSYRIAALKRVPFHLNSLGYSFDSDIIIQFVAAGLSIREVPIPTYYGDELCRVDGVKYARACIAGAIQYRLMQLEIFYDPKFDIHSLARRYTIKSSPTSLHDWIRRLPLAAGSELLDFGGGDGAAVGLPHAARGVHVTVVDRAGPAGDEPSFLAMAHPNIQRLDADLDGEWIAGLSVRQFHVVFALDVLEHLKSPELTVQLLFSAMAPGGKLYASTGNVCFWPLRLMHMMGHFNYGRRGILDLTHTRLFTVSSFRRMLRDAGFQINFVRCFGPPIADLAGGRPRLLRSIDRISALLARHWSGLFGYQILIEAIRPDSVQDLLKRTFPDQHLSIADDSAMPFLRRPQGAGRSFERHDPRPPASPNRVHD